MSTYKIPKKRLKELAQLANIPDEQIDYSDIPATDEEFWKDARLVRPNRKHPVYLRMDEDLYQWFKKHGKGYQTRINAALRFFVKTHAVK
jgi:uncharacterized protein (DUF4415 family)